MRLGGGVSTRAFLLPLSRNFLEARCRKCADFVQTPGTPRPSPGTRKPVVDDFPSSFLGRVCDVTTFYVKARLQPLGKPTLARVTDLKSSLMQELDLLLGAETWFRAHKRENPLLC